MDWQKLGFDWNRARAFLATAEEGSLSAAARALGLTQPTLGRQVAALEEELDVVLFERVGRGLTLTPAGLELLDHVRAMAQAAGRLALSASGHAQSIDGEVCVSAAELVSAALFPPILRALRSAHPGIRVKLIATNKPSDLQRREADIAVRSFRPTEPELVAKKIKEVKARFYAAPSYLERMGPLDTHEELSRAEFISFEDTERWQKALVAMGLSVSDESFPLRAENHLVHWQLVKEGLGVTMMQEDIGDAEPSVVRVGAHVEPMSIPMWLVAHREVHTSRRVRLVFDHIYDALAAT